MESDVRSIGELARDSGLTVSALRFYDGAGVLSPASVDPQTGYRRYATEQVHEARLVARLRRVGMPLAEIRRVLAHRTDPAAAGQVLDAHLRRLEDGLTDARRELSLVRAALDQQETSMTDHPTSTRLTVAGADLVAALDAVRFAAAADPAQPALNGVLFDVRDGRLWLVATDRYRLAVAPAALRACTGPDIARIVPTALADEARTLAAAGGDATLTLVGDDITVQTGNGRVTGRCIDHGFPDYRRLLRSSGTHRVAVDAVALSDLLSAPTGLTSVREQDGAEYDVAVLTVDPDGMLTVGADSSGDRLRVGVNREFLLEALQATALDQLVLELDSSIAPLAIRAPGQEHPLSLLMPTRLP